MIGCLRSTFPAGCSSDEEPCMLCILVMEFFGREYEQLNAGVLATNISDQALSKARLGIYSEEQVSRIPSGLRSKYLTVSILTDGR